VLEKIGYILIMLAHWNNSPWVDISFQYDALPLFRAFAHWCCLWSGEVATNANYLVLALQHSHTHSNSYISVLHFKVKQIFYSYMYICILIVSINAYPHHASLKCLCQARLVYGQVYVCYGYRVCLCFYDILIIL
jgi:hypothetical protein